MRLTDIKRGEKARIVGFEGGRGFQRNLETMGVRRGKVVEVLAKHPAGGPMVIRINNLTVTMGRGMAMKIMVEEV
jgi:ferrous iron transport protein A